MGSNSTGTICGQDEWTGRTGAMKIVGRDFMAWFDTWEPVGVYWDYDVLLGADPLHDDGGNWKLSPDEEYDVTSLGWIASEELKQWVDTEKVLQTWLSRRGLTLAMYRLEKSALPAFEKKVKASGGKVIKERAPAGSVRVVDFIDWYENAVLDDHYVEEHGEPFHDDDGGWRLDLEGFVVPDEICVLLPQEGGDSRLDIDAEVRRYMRSRDEVVALCLVPPAFEHDLDNSPKVDRPGRAPSP